MFTVLYKLYLFIISYCTGQYWAVQIASVCHITFYLAVHMLPVFLSLFTGWYTLYSFITILIMYWTVQIVLVYHIIIYWTFQIVPVYHIIISWVIQAALYYIRVSYLLICLDCTHVSYLLICLDCTRMS